MRIVKALGVALLGVFAAGVVSVMGLQWHARQGERALQATLTPADGATREVAFVANGVGGTVTLVDVEAMKVLGEVDVVPDGKTVGFLRDPVQSLMGQPLMERGGKNYAQDQEISPDGRVLYVSRGHLGDVVAIDLASRRILWRMPVSGLRADHAVLSQDGARLYVSALTANKVEVFDAASGQRIGNFSTGNWPHDNRLSRDGRRIYNASIGVIPWPLSWRAGRSRWMEWLLGPSYQLTEVDAASLKPIHRYAFPAGIRPWRLDVAERKVYAQLSDYHGVVEYDLASQKVVRRLDLPVHAGVTVADWDFEAPHHGMDMTRDGKLLCIAGRASDYVGLISTESMQALALVPVDDAPSWATFSRDERYCLVPNTRADTVSMVSVAQRREVARLRVGRGPKHIRIGMVSDGTLAGFLASGALPAATGTTP